MALNLSGIPSVPMRMIFMVMFCMVTWTAVGLDWVGSGYLLSNYFVVLIGIWAEYDKISPVPVQIFFFGMLFTLLNDIINIGVRFEGSKNGAKAGGVYNTFNFNATCYILLILVKPVASLFIYKEWSFRVNSDEGEGQAPNASAYERLDQNNGGGAYGGYGGAKDQPPQYQPPQQPFP